MSTQPTASQKRILHLQWILAAVIRTLDTPEPDAIRLGPPEAPPTPSPVCASPERPPLKQPSILKYFSK